LKAGIPDQFLLIKPGGAAAWLNPYFSVRPGTKHRSQAGFCSFGK